MFYQLSYKHREQMGIYGLCQIEIIPQKKIQHINSPNVSRPNKSTDFIRPLLDHLPTLVTFDSNMTLHFLYREEFQQVLLKRS